MGQHRRRAPPGRPSTVARCHQAYRGRLGRDRFDRRALRRSRVCRALGWRRVTRCPAGRRGAGRRRLRRRWWCRLGRRGRRRCRGGAGPCRRRGWRIRSGERVVPETHIVTVADCRVRNPLWRVRPGAAAAGDEEHPVRTRGWEALGIARRLVIDLADSDPERAVCRGGVLDPAGLEHGEGRDGRGVEPDALAHHRFVAELDDDPGVMRRRRLGAYGRGRPDSRGRGSRAEPDREQRHGERDAQWARGHPRLRRRVVGERPGQPDPRQLRSHLVAGARTAVERIRCARKRGRDLGGGEGIGSGVAGEGVAAAGVLGGDQLGERGVATRRPAGRLRVLPGGEQGLDHQGGGIGVGAGARLVGEAAVTVLLGVQPGQRRGIAALRPRRVERHQHHRRGVGVAGVEVGGAVGIVFDEQEVPAAITVLSGDEVMDRGDGHRLAGGDQALDGQRLGECLAIAVDAGAVHGLELGDQVDAAEGAGVEVGGDHRLDEQPACARTGAGRGGMTAQVGHHRRAGAVSQRLGVVTGGGRPDRVLLADRVGARPLRDRSVRPRLLRLQILDRPRRRVDLRGCSAIAGGEDERCRPHRRGGRKRGHSAGPAHGLIPHAAMAPHPAGVVLAA